MILSLACDTILILSQEALFCYPHHFRLLYSPQHSWGIRLFIYSEAALTGKPVFCIVDDTIAAKTKPSSRALHPIEDAYFHQSHLKGKQDYGHQAVSVMLSCNGIVLNYAFVLYNKAISKIDIVSELAAELSVTHKNFDLVTVKGRNSSLTPTMSTLPA